MAGGSETPNVDPPEQDVEGIALGKKSPFGS
jgi:hypothetical protein